MQRRTMLKLFAGGAAAVALGGPRWAVAAAPSDEFFIFIHAAGGWDVTLWADPRTERVGLIEPPSTLNTDVGGMTRWRSRRLEGDVATFDVLDPGSALPLGPAIGDLYDLRDRLTVINGVAMNTVSHLDGTTYSATGRHLSGGKPVESSIDVLVASELGASQLMPAVSVRFPSAFVGPLPDRRAIPLRVGDVDAITRAFARSDKYLGTDDRDAISALLTTEAEEAATHLGDRDTLTQLAGQQRALPRLLSGEFTDAFAPRQLQAAYPAFDYRSRTYGTSAIAAAFALEAIRRNVLRCVSFGLGGLDTHARNYRQHGQTLHDLFGIVATLVKQLDVLPHPTKPGAMLGAHTHILVVSDFCRTPQINLGGGRDHYPNNSALVVSPRFRAGRTFGATDLEQLLPRDAPGFLGGPRPPTPADVLATFLGAFQIDPRRYMRDGEIISALLR
jgi:hypothetical protein